VTAAQLGISDVARVDRGAATALYFSIYYSLGALGAYLPGVAWQEWGWGGVAAVGFLALVLAAAGLAAASLGRRSEIRDLQEGRAPA
jgi:predicted MFS family arabinose efflux permease